jgi:type I restriction enzyme S subunit
MADSKALRRHILTLDNGAWGDEPDGASHERLCIRAADFDYSTLRARVDRAPMRKYDERTATRLRLLPGDLILEKSGGGEGQPVGRAVLFDEFHDAICTNFAARLRPAAHVDSRFLTYLLAHMYSIGVTARCINQTTGIQNLNTDLWLSERVHMPPLVEQRRIADFLDNQVTRIDQLVTLRERQMEALEQHEKASAEAAVWGSLSSEPRIERVIEPGPAIPRNWRAVPNRYLLAERSDLSTDGSEELLSVSHLTGVTPRSEKSVTMFLAETFEGYKRVQEGDLVINTLWAWMGALGVSKLRGIVSPAYGVYVPITEAYHPGYFDALYRSTAYVCEMTRHSKGVWSSRLRLYPDAFLALSAPVPPLIEQERIALEIEHVRNASEPRIAMLKKSVALLQEYKRSLITAAVTGEFDVSAASGRGVPA